MDENMDKNIDNYSIQDLYDILDLNDNSTDEQVNKNIDKLIEKIGDSDDYDLIDFFENVRKKLLDNNNSKTEIVNDTVIERKYLNIEHNKNVNVTQDKINPNYKNTINRLLCIDSEHRQHIIPHSKDVNSISCATNYTMDLSEPIKNVVSMRMYSYCIPYSWCNISENKRNNFFYVDSSRVDISDGIYTKDELIQEIGENTVFKDKCYIKYSKKTGIVDISGINGIHGSTIKFWDLSHDWKINSNLGWLLGFRPETSTIHDISNLSFSLSKKIFGQSPINTFGPKHLYIVVDDYNNNYINKGIINITDYNLKLKLPKYFSQDISYSLNSNGKYNVDTKYNKNNINPPNGENGEELMALTQKQAYTIENILNQNEINNKRVTPPLSQNVIGIIKLDKTPDKRFEYYSSTHIYQNTRDYFGPVDIDRLKIKLVDDRGEIVDLRGLDWNFTLSIEQLYQY